MPGSDTVMQVHLFREVEKIYNKYCTRISSHGNDASSFYRRKSFTNTFFANKYVGDTDKLVCAKI